MPAYVCVHVLRSVMASLFAKSELCGEPGRRLLRPDLYQVVRYGPGRRHKEVQVLVLLATPTCTNLPKNVILFTASFNHQAAMGLESLPVTGQMFYLEIMSVVQLAVKTGLLTDSCVLPSRIIQAILSVSRQLFTGFRPP